MKFIKWSFIGVGAVLAVLLLLLMGVQLYLNTERAQQQIQTAVNQAIPGRITWSKSSLSILRGEVKLHHVLLSAPNNDKLVELNRFLLRVSWIRLLKRELRVKNLLLETPQIYLAVDRFGALNLMQALYAPENDRSNTTHSGLPFNVVIRELQVRNGFFQYQTEEAVAEKQKHRVVLNNVHLTVMDGDLLKQKGRFVCEIDGGNINISGSQGTIGQLSLTGNLEKDRIGALIIDANMGGSYLKVSGNIDHLFAESPLLDLDIKSEVSLSKIKDFIPFTPDLTGSVQADSTIHGPLNNPDINLMLDYGGGNIAGRTIGRINLTCRLEDRYLTINESNLNTSAGTFDIEGDVDFRKAFAKGFISSHPETDAISYKLSVRQKDTHLENVSLLKGSRLKGVINSIIKLEGTGIDPRTLKAETALELFAKGLSAREASSPADVHVTAQASMNKGHVTIQQFEAQAGRTHLKANGGYDISSLEVAANFILEAPDMTELMSHLGMKAFGKMNINGDLYGTVKAPMVKVRLQGENIGFDRVKIGDADAKIQFSEGMLSLDHGKIRNRNSTLDISGIVRIRDPITRQILENPSLDIALKGDTLFIEDFAEGMKGKFSVNGHIFGNTAHPQGTLNFNGENIDVYEQKVHSIQLTSYFNNDKINFDPFTVVTAPGEKIWAEGWISLNKDYHLRLTSGDISLKNITQLHLGEFDNGKISFDFEGKGNFENPQLEGKVALNDLRFNGQHLKDVQLRIEVKDQTAQISGDPNFALDAFYHLKTKAFSASAGFDNTNLTPYLKIAGRSELNGSITGKIEVNGNAEALDQISGTADISRIEIFWKQAELIGASDSKVFLKDGEISTPGLRLNLLKRGVLEIKGNGKLNGDLNIKADGNIPLEIIASLTDVLTNTTGEVLLSLNINGSLSQPYLRGDVELKNAGMIVPGIFQNMHDLYGSVQVTPEAVVLDNIQGMLDTGHFTLSGTIYLQQYQLSKVNLKCKADDLPIMIPETLETRLNAQLDIRGTPEKSLVSGYVQMLEGKYYKDIQLNLIESLGKKSREETLVSSEIPRPFFENMALDISTGYTEPFVVDNNMALLAVKPDLHIYGTVNRPIISGRAQVESGTVYFQKKEFNVKRGVFDFINPYKIEPTIDVQSEVMIREWTVFLNVSGTPENLKFNFSSDPSEKEEDVLSLLITGKTTRELIAGEGGSSLSPGQMLADVLAETVQKQIKDAIGLDVVALEYNKAKDAEASNEVKVTVGKELSRRVTVKYGMQTRNAKVIQQVITEYKFLEKLLVNAFQDTEGQYGGGLQFRFEFR